MGRRRTYRRYRKARRYARKAVKSGTKSAVGWLASKAWEGVKMLKDVVNTEYKYFDVAENNVNVDYNGYLPGLCTPGQGDTDSQRDGDRLKMQNLTFRAQLKRNGADADIRVIILMDKQVKVASASDVLESTGAAANATISPKNYDKRYQTRILYDRRWQLSTDRPQIDITFTKQLNMHTQFSAGTTTITSGKLMAIFISNINASTPQISYYSRVTYTDN